MTTRRPLILDMDGTLLHSEPVPDALVIPGRTRPSYLSRTVTESLSHLSQRFDVVLATGRSWAGMQVAVEGLQRHGVAIAGLCVEDGAKVGRPGSWTVLEPHRDWHRLRTWIDAVSGDPAWPSFEWQEDFQSCLVARAATYAEARTLAPLLFARATDDAPEPGLRVFRDGRKVFLIGAAVNKWQALGVLLGERAASSAGFGDGLNDVCWLSRIADPGTLRGCAPEVLQAVLAAGGVVASQGGHEGIAELLRTLSPR
ncbi:MAG: hypothetical protein HC884_09610 [Chloroflexaceae bacterium]|nr:hypothetical protein [Chloroflexaceae bacterium]